MHRKLAPKVIGVDLDVLTPLLGDSILFEDCAHWTGGFTRTAIDTLIWINIELAVPIVVVFAASWMNAVNRANIYTRAVFHANTRLRNHIGHWLSLLSGKRFFRAGNAWATIEEAIPHSIIGQEKEDGGGKQSQIHHNLSVGLAFGGVDKTIYRGMFILQSHPPVNPYCDDFVTILGGQERQSVLCSKERRENTSVAQV
jgi:hypothetical protein